MADDIIFVADDGTRRKTSNDELLGFLDLPLDSEEFGLESSDGENNNAILAPTPDDVLLQRLDDILQLNTVQEVRVENLEISDANEERDQVQFVTKASCSKSNKNKRPTYTWKNKALRLAEEKIKFLGVTDLPSKVLSLDTPFQFFSYFFDDELYKQIVEQTQLYSAQKDPSKVFQFSKTTLQRYLGVCVLSSILTCPLRDLWDPILGNEMVKSTMPVNTFEKIRELLHFNDNNKALPPDHPQFDKLFKIRPIIDYMI